uniref:G domain-containing protein n=1 Tax=Amphimedon queenslandica TaxID=400682 RepID=A0A1X7USQ1_AMPQE
MSLEDKCWDAFRKGDHKKAVHLLPLVKEPNKIKKIVWNNTSLLHLSSRNGWLDVTKDLITKYHCDPQERDSTGETCLHYAADGNHVDVMRYLINECHCDPMATENKGETALHKAAAEYNSPDVIKYLINECNCDPTIVDRRGWTPLHNAAHWGDSKAVECLLSTGKCDPLAKDNYGNTPLQLAKEAKQRGWGKNTLPFFKKFGDIKSSHSIDSYVSILSVGNPGAGKSTLSHVINDTATGSIVLGSFRNVGGVVPCTAGIIPYKLKHRTLGNIILHDFAGHSKYYSSHTAVIENLLQGSSGVFLIVVNILEKEPVKQLHQWLTVVRNETQKALNQCHVIVIVSHVDEIFTNPFERRRRKEEIQEIIVREKCDSVFLDCRKHGGSGMNSFFNKVSSACESIRSTSGRNLNLYCHMMYGLLEERKENILTLSDVMSAGKNNDDYFIPNNREDVLDVLDSLHSTGLISVLKSEDKVWVVVNKGILLTEVNGILFAPETFKEHVDIASNTGIVTVSGLTRLFPKYDPHMLICFLKNMELCQQMNDPSFLRMTNLHQLAVEEEEEEGGTERRGERLLFFPCLLSTDRPDEMISQVYQFGWCLQCTSKHHFFPPRYFHVLSLRLAYKMALPQKNDKLNRYCTFWKNGLYWFNGHGVGSLVEIVNESQCVLVMMSCEKGYSDNMVSLRRYVIGEVMSVYKESCPSLEVKELVIDPKELAYPVNTPRERTVYNDKCWAAFTKGDHNEAVRLLPLVKEPNKIKGGYAALNITSLLHLSSRHGWLDVTKHLITKYHCDPEEKDSGGQTCLYYAAIGNHVDVMRYLIDECHCNPMDFNSFGETVLHRAADYGSLDVMKNVRRVVPCTAGIIPYKRKHRTLGNIILHDFAGHSEYYSSHSAVLENLLQGSGGVFLIVVNILEKEPVKQLHRWLTVVRNEAQKALNQCHVIVIVSHKDEISNPVERRMRKEEIREIIVRERCDSVFLDCRKLGGSGVDSFFNKLSSACKSIRSTSGRNLSLYCHMMYGLLEERKENILTLSDVMLATEDNNDYIIPNNKEEVMDVLHSLHLTGLMSVLKSEDKVWVVVNKGILLTEVDGILFAPETFKEHVDIASNTGIVSVSGLTRLFPKYDPDMLICFLNNMELCQQINPFFLRMTNLRQLAVEEEEEGGTERRKERLFFFPCLLNMERPKEITSQVYQFGWCLQCTSKHHFFPSRYFHVLSLRLAYKMALPQKDNQLMRRCTFWKNGLYWSNSHGVGSLVEIVDESQCVLVMMSCEKGYSDNMVSLRRDVIGEVMSVYKESCPSLEVTELVIDPKELAYPVNTPRERTVYSVKDILSAIDKRERYVVHDNGTRTELKEVLPDESLSDISNLSLLGGRDIKEVIKNSTQALQ